MRLIASLSYDPGTLQVWNHDCLLSSENGHFLLPALMSGTNYHNNSVPCEILLLLRNTSELTFYILFLSNFGVLTFVLHGGLFYCTSAHYEFEWWWWWCGCGYISCCMCWDISKGV